MTEKEELLFQSSRHPNIEDLRWKNGFLYQIETNSKVEEVNFPKVIKAELKID